MGARIGAADWAIARPVACASSRRFSVHVGHGVAVTLDGRRLHVSHGTDGWQVEQVWQTNAISPYFNDLVIYDKHLYGFDGAFLVCVNLDTGKRRWKERGYGTGQVLLLDDQGVLLVLAETGEVALVAAQPSGLNELARIDALEGKTWNHPVIAHGRLYVRNAEEIACYKLE